MSLLDRCTLSFPPRSLSACLAVLSLFPSRRQTRQSGQSIWNYDSRVRFHGRPTSVGLGSPIIVFPLAGGQTL
jgi:hypothetical protein